MTSHLLCKDNSYRKIDRTLFGLPAATKDQRADPYLITLNLFYISVLLRKKWCNTGCLWQKISFIHHPLIASLCLHKLCQLIKCLSTVDCLLQHLSCLLLILCDLCHHKHTASKCHAKLCEIRRSMSLQCFDCFLYLKGISYSISKWLIHIRDHSHHFSSGIFPNRHHLTGKQHGICFFLHKSTASRLHIKDNGICSGCQLFTHNRGCDQ